jgi:hypothetical protein
VFGGISFGLGFPSSLAFLADSTVVEERARVSGAIILTTFLSIVILIGVTQRLGFAETVFVFAILRVISYPALLIDRCERLVCKERSWNAVLTTPGFWLFFASWLMFSIAGGVFSFIEVAQENISMQGTILLYVGVVISALISGFVADRFGRKKLIMFGLFFLGISYVVFGIAASPEAYLLTRIIYGAAWGIIFVTYMLTIIGDFAKACSKEKFYTIGLVVPLIVFMVFLQGFSETPTISMDASITALLLSVILYVAIIPLFYAPETLPKEKIRGRKIREHLKKVRELVQEEEAGD